MNRDGSTSCPKDGKVLETPELHEDEEPPIPPIVRKSMSATRRGKEKLLEGAEVHPDASTIPSVEQARRNEREVQETKAGNHFAKIAASEGNTSGDSEPTSSPVGPSPLTRQDELATDINITTVPGALSIAGIDSRLSTEDEIDPTDPLSQRNFRAPRVADEENPEILISAAVVENEPKAPIYNAEHVRYPSRNLIIGIAVAACVVTAIIVPAVLLTARSNETGGSPSFPSTSPTTTTSPSLQPSSMPSLNPSTAPTQLSEMILDLLVEKSLDGGSALVTDGTDQNRAYQWLVTENTGLPTYSEQQIVQRYVLATLFFATKGDGWYRNDGWLSNEDECTSWFPSGDESVFPFCDPVGRVASLDLSGTNLQGTIPLELALLSDSLTRIFVRQNYLTGTLPSAIGMLSKLEAIDLRANFVSGVVPAETSSWSGISLIDINDNGFYGKLPFHSWPHLEIYDAGDNVFSGSVPFVIGNSTLLRSLVLDRNMLTGPLPSVLGNLQQMTDLSVQNNRFTSLPSMLPLMLRELDVTNSSVGASLPVEWFSLTNLEEFLASSNGAIGRIPTTIGLLTKLELLRLQSNYLFGSIPTEIGLLAGNTRLYEILLNDNKFDSQLPSEIGQLREYRKLSLEKNSFVGSIPVGVCEYVNATYSSVRADCQEIDCPCCLYCCSDHVEDCVCTLEGELAPVFC